MKQNADARPGSNRPGAERSLALERRTPFLILRRRFGNHMDRRPRFAGIN